MPHGTNQPVPNDRETYLAVKETAAFLRVFKMTVWRFLRSGKLKKYKCGGRVLIRLRDANKSP
jgi:excisionase family DNA binding protein